MFEGLWAVAYKEVKHVTRDPATRFVFVLPVLQLVIFGYAVGMNVRDIPMGYVDADQTSTSRLLIEKFGASDTFDVVATFASQAELDEALTAGDVRAGCLIPHGFSRDLLRGKPAEVLMLVDGSYSTEATAAVSAARALVTAAGAELTGMPPIRAPDAVLANPAQPVDVRGRYLFNPELRSAVFFVPGLVGIILQIVTVLLTAFSIVRERELGTFEQLMVTPVGAWGLFVGKLLPYAVVSFVQAIVVLLAMVYVFAVPIAGSLAALLVLTALFVVTSLSLGVIVSTVTRTQTEAMQAAFVIILPSILLSGFVFPLQTVPELIRPLSRLIPVRYYIDILRALIVRGADVHNIWEPAAALAVYTVALLILGALRFKKRLD